MCVILATVLSPLAWISLKGPMEPPYPIWTPAHVPWDSGLMAPAQCTGRVAKCPSPHSLPAV